MSGSLSPWAIVASALALAASACLPTRIPPGSEEELVCAAMLNCWYPGEQGSQFDEAGEAWTSMANDDNEQNVRRAYGTDGTCWQVDPMAGGVSDGEPVGDRALVESCGAACACAILELCDKQELPADAAPACAAGASDPCDIPGLDAMCGEG